MNRENVLVEKIRRRFDLLVYQTRFLLQVCRMALHYRSAHGQKPVVFFHASTGVHDLSQNAGFSLLTSWAVRLSGVPVVHFICKAGMSRCPMGTNPDQPQTKPPCKTCIRQRRLQNFGSHVHHFKFHRDEDLAREIQGRSIDELMQFTYNGIPLGRIVLPSLRWRMRVHHLPENDPTRFLYREFIISAWNVANEFTTLLDRVEPQSVVLFNGQFFPEATARFLADKRGIRTLTHEVGLQPLSAYFTRGEATAYPIDIPESFKLDAGQDTRLDAYLENRFQGKFSMAGIQFWPEMKGLDEAFLKKAAGFRQIVPIFTNVVFDTSQPHSNVIFPDMFAWLDLVLGVVKHHTETLFVLRAHPDETRPGKAARESVAMWVERTGAAQLPNLIFIPSDEYISSYELIQHAKFVMIYNSTIGLEASIMGAAVLSAGKARFTQYPIVFFPDSRQSYRQQFYSFLSTEEIQVPVMFQRNARRFLYYQLFRTSLPFEAWLEPGPRRGFVRLKFFQPETLRSEQSATIQTLLEGILADGDLMLKE